MFVISLATAQTANDNKNMCDTLIKRDIPVSEIPEFTYKLMQKTSDGKYVSCVMGEPIPFGVWHQAPRRKASKYDTGKPLISLLKRTLDTRYPKSSRWSNHHNGRWASFEVKERAMYCGLVSNFIDASKRTSWMEDNLLPTVVVKCQIGGRVDSSKWSGHSTYLSSSIKIVEEIGLKR